jgi:ATP-dependent Clp protease adapter protein ClpS
VNFVVAALRQHLGLEPQAAMRTTAAVHTMGSAIVALPLEADAARIAQAIVAEAHRLEYPLVCRSLDA